jgi:hypothetical protein
MLHHHDTRHEPVIGCAAEVRQRWVTRQTSKRSEAGLRSFPEEFYVICGASVRNATVRSALLFITTHCFIKHHPFGSPAMQQEQV